MREVTFQRLLKGAYCDVSIVGSFSDFVCFAVVCADSVGRDNVKYSDCLTDWAVWGSNSGGGKVFRTSPYPASCTMGTGSFPAVKWPGRNVDHPLPSKAEIKEKVEVYLYSPIGLHYPFCGEIYLHLY
jgi:hypothetical protein